MVHYSFGALANLSQTSVCNGASSIAPVTQHVTVLNRQAVLHPTNPQFARLVSTYDSTTPCDVVATAVCEVLAPHHNRTSTISTVPPSASTSLLSVAGASTAASTTNTVVSLPTAAAATTVPPPAAAATTVPLPAAAASTTVLSPAAAASNATAPPVAAASTTTAPHAAAASTTVAAAAASTTVPAAAASTTVPAPPVAAAAAAASTTTAPPVPPLACLDDVIRDLKTAPRTAGLEIAESSSMCTRNYDAKKRKLMREFVDALRAKAPKYDTLILPSKDKPEEFPPGDVAEVFVLLSGPEEKRKKVHVLNQMLIDWVAEKENKVSRTGNGGGNRFPTPSTLNCMIRTFFAATKSTYGWEFGVTDFQFEGGYNGFFKELCLRRQKNDVSKNDFLFKRNLSNSSVNSPSFLLCSMTFLPPCPQSTSY